MSVKEINHAIDRSRTKLEALIKERNQLIISRYKELYNIDTWHKLKAEYVYSTIAKESGLSISLIKKVILTNK
jgi:hypothetical protein